MYSTSTYTQAFFRDACKICDALYKAVLPSFGPYGLDQMLVGITRTLITNQGHAILSSLIPDHPTASLVLKMIQSHVNRCGDGSSTIVIQLREALELLHEHIYSSPQNIHGEKAAHTIRLKLLHSLQKIRYELTCDGIGSLKEKLIRDYCIRIMLNNNVNNDIINLSMLHLTRTLFSGKFTSRISDILAEKTCDYILNCCTCINNNNNQSSNQNNSNDYSYIISKMLKDIPILTQCPSIVENTIVEPGYFLDCKLSNQIKLGKNLKIIILNCTFHTSNITDDSTDNIIAQVSNQQEFESFVTYNDNNIRDIVNYLINQNINMIISTQILHPITIQMCTDAGIAVISNVDYDDLSFLCIYLKTTVCSSISETQSIYYTYGYADTCYEHKLNNRWYLQFQNNTFIQADYSNNNVNYNPQTLIIHGSSSGVCEQYIYLIKRALRMLYHALSPINTQAKSIDNIQKCDYCDKYGEKMKRCSMCKVSYYCNVQHQKYHWKKHKLMCSSQLRNNNHNHNNDNDNIELLYLVPGAGVFECALYKHFQHEQKKYAENNDNNDVCMSIAYNILSQISISTLKILFKASDDNENDNEIYDYDDKRRFIYKFQNIKCIPNSNMFLISDSLSRFNDILDRKSKTTSYENCVIAYKEQLNDRVKDGTVFMPYDIVDDSPISNGVIECLSVKLQTWESMIDILLCLLKVSEIGEIGTSKVKIVTTNDNDSSDTE